MMMGSEAIEEGGETEAEEKGEIAYLVRYHRMSYKTILSWEVGRTSQPTRLRICLMSKTYQDIVSLVLSLYLSLCSWLKQKSKTSAIQRWWWRAKWVIHEMERW
jgi:hypothetical protein